MAARPSPYGTYAGAATSAGLLASSAGTAGGGGTVSGHRTGAASAAPGRGVATYALGSPTNSLFVPMAPRAYGDASMASLPPRKATGATAMPVLSPMTAAPTPLSPLGPASGGSDTRAHPTDGTSPAVGPPAPEAPPRLSLFTELQRSASIASSLREGGPSVSMFWHHQASPPQQQPPQLAASAGAAAVPPTGHGASLGGAAGTAWPGTRSTGYAAAAAAPYATASPVSPALGRRGSFSRTLPTGLLSPLPPQALPSGYPSYGRAPGDSGAVAASAAYTASAGSAASTGSPLHALHGGYPTSGGMRRAGWPASGSDHSQAAAATRSSATRRGVRLLAPRSPVAAARQGQGPDGPASPSGASSPRSPRAPARAAHVAPAASPATTSSSSPAAVPMSAAHAGRSRGGASSPARGDGRDAPTGHVAAAPRSSLSLPAAAGPFGFGAISGGWYQQAAVAGGSPPPPTAAADLRLLSPLPHLTTGTARALAAGGPATDPPHRSYSGAAASAAVARTPLPSAAQPTIPAAAASAPDNRAHPLPQRGAGQWASSSLSWLEPPVPLRSPAGLAAATSLLDDGWRRGEPSMEGTRGGSAGGMASTAASRTAVNPFAALAGTPAPAATDSALTATNSSGGEISALNPAMGGTSATPLPSPPSHGRATLSSPPVTLPLAPVRDETGAIAGAASDALEGAGHAWSPATSLPPLPGHENALVMSHRIVRGVGGVLSLGGVSWRGRNPAALKINQDAVLAAEHAASGILLVAVFDGHGQNGREVAQHFRDRLPAHFFHDERVARMCASTTPSATTTAGGGEAHITTPRRPGSRRSAGGSKPRGLAMRAGGSVGNGGDAEDAAVSPPGGDGGGLSPWDSSAEGEGGSSDSAHADSGDGGDGGDGRRSGSRGSSRRTPSGGRPTSSSRRTPLRRGSSLHAGFASSTTPGGPAAGGHGGGSALAGPSAGTGSGGMSLTASLTEARALCDTLADALAATEHELLRATNIDCSLSGCTAVVAIVRHGIVSMVNVGDSRCVIASAAAASGLSFDAARFATSTAASTALGSLAPGTPVIGIPLPPRAPSIVPASPRTASNAAPFPSMPGRAWAGTRGTGESGGESGPTAGGATTGYDMAQLRLGALATEPSFASPMVRSRMLSIDHKPDTPREKQRIIAAGGRVFASRIKGAPNVVGPARVWLRSANVPGLNMSRSMGDLIGKQAGVVSTPFKAVYVLQPHDRTMVLASDGIWDWLPNDEVAALSLSSLDTVEASMRLMRLSRARWLARTGGADDTSAIIVRLVGSGH